MTQEEKKRLEKNLRKSASRARTGYVRIKTGPLSEDQGFAPIGSLPIIDPITETETSLDNLLLEIKRLDEESKVNIESLEILNKRLDLIRKELEEKDQVINQLDNRIRSIEIFHLD